MPRQVTNRPSRRVRKLAAQLRGAENRMKELEAKIRHQEDRADRAEKWLHHISVEIEDKFFGRDKAASTPQR